jgi:macrolide transport system ATP-binding/permease protein
MGSAVPCAAPASAVEPRDVRSLVLTQVVRITAVGGVAGPHRSHSVWGGLGEALFFGVQGYDAAVVGSAVLLVAIVAATASAVPTRRAATVNPIEALRTV